MIAAASAPRARRRPARLGAPERHALEQTWRGLRALERRPIVDGVYLRAALAGLLGQDWAAISLPGLDAALPVIAARVEAIRTADVERLHRPSAPADDHPVTATAIAARQLLGLVSKAMVQLAELAKSDPAEAKRLAELVLAGETAGTVR